MGVKKPIEKLTNEEQMIVEKNQGLVFSVLGRHFQKFLTNPLTRDDVIQCAQMGLIYGVIAYRDTSKRELYKFSTIATRHIQNSVMEYLKIMECVKESHNAQKYHLKSNYHIIGITNENMDSEGGASYSEVQESSLEDINGTNYDDVIERLDNNIILNDVRKFIGEKEYKFLMDYYSVNNVKEDLKRISKKTDYASYYSNLKHKKALIKKIRSKYPKYINNF